MSAYVQTVVGSDSPPVGAVMDFAGNVEPSGWLFCFGQSLPRTGIYAQLFSVIGTLYGAPDGSSFSLPDFRGRVGAGKDDMGGTGSGLLSITKTGTTTNGSPTITALSGDVTGLAVGMFAIGTGIPSGAYIVNCASVTSTQLSANCTASGTGPIRFYHIDGLALGAKGGLASYSLKIPEMPNHAHVARHNMIGSPQLMGGSNWNMVNAGVELVGGDLPHINIQPTFIVNKIIKYTVSGTVLPIVPGEGDVVGPNGVVDGEMALFNGTSGKLLKATAKLIVGDTVRTGYAAGTVVIPALATSADVVMASPGAFDDHFEGAALNAKWTFSGLAAGGGVATSAVAGSCVNLNCQSATQDGIRSYSYISQNLPNANNFIVSLKLNYQAYAHTVASSVGAIEIDVNSITPSIQGLKLKISRAYITGVGGYESFMFNTGLGLNTTYATFYGDVAPYHRFIWTRTPLTLEWQMSFDGVTWMSMKYGLIASAQTGFNGTTLLPQQVGISATALYLGQALTSVDWVKFVNF